MKAVAALPEIGVWNRSHHLDRMTLRELVVACRQYYAIQACLAVVAVAFAVYNPPSLAAGLAVAAFTFPIGYLIGGPGAAAIALASGLLTTCFYEFCHCIQLLSHKPKAEWLAPMTARHMAHHFHDETGNFGITNFGVDKLPGTFYERTDRPNKSPSVFNLGYSEEVALTDPYVKELSGGIIATGHPRKRETA